MEYVLHVNVINIQLEKYSPIIFFINYESTV